MYRQRAVPGVNDKDTTHWSFAVIGHQSAGRDDIYVISLGLIEMDAVSAVKFGARFDSVSAIKGMNHEQHWLFPMVRSIMPPHTLSRSSHPSRMT